MFEVLILVKIKAQYISQCTRRELVMPEINTKGTICFNTMLLKLNMKLIHYFHLSNLSTGL